MTENRTHTNISVDRETYERLREHGKAGDSFCDVIKSLLDEKERQEINNKTRAVGAAIPAK
jgi:predicted CopG family antitoxin